MSFRKTGKSPIIGVLDKTCVVCGGTAGRCAHTSVPTKPEPAAPPASPPTPPSK